MGKDDSIIGAIGGLIAAIGNEVDIISPSSSPSTPSTSGSGSHSNGYGGSDGGSSTNWSGVTERTNAQGKPVHYVVRVGNKDNIYPAGLSGYFNALLGGQPVAVSEYIGNKIEHKDENGKPAGKSVVHSDGSIESWDKNGKYRGSKKPDIPARKGNTSSSNKNYADSQYAPALEDGYYLAVKAAEKQDRLAKEEAERKALLEQAKQAQIEFEDSERIRLQEEEERQAQIEQERIDEENRQERRVTEAQEAGARHATADACRGTYRDRTYHSEDETLVCEYQSEYSSVYCEETYSQQTTGYQDACADAKNNALVGWRRGRDLSGTGKPYQEAYRESFQSFLRDAVDAEVGGDFNDIYFMARRDGSIGSNRVMDYSGFPSVYVDAHKRAYNKGYTEGRSIRMKNLNQQQYDLGFQDGVALGEEDKGKKRRMVFSYSGYCQEYIQGHKDGYEQGYDDESRRDYDAGLECGRKDGNTDGVWGIERTLDYNTLTTSFIHGYVKTYAKAYDQACDTERSRGRENGLADGRADGENGVERILYCTDQSCAYIVGYIETYAKAYDKAWENEQSEGRKAGYFDARMDGENEHEETFYYGDHSSAYIAGYLETYGIVFDKISRISRRRRERLNQRRW